MKEYTYGEKLTEKIIVLHSQYGTQIFTICTARKEHKCVVMGIVINKGDLCYRPNTNKNNRMKRISIDGMSELESLATQLNKEK